VTGRGIKAKTKLVFFLEKKHGLMRGVPTKGGEKKWTTGKYRPDKPSELSKQTTKEKSPVRFRGERGCELQ